MHITELHQSNSVLLFSVVENIWALEIWNGDIWFGSLLGSQNILHSASRNLGVLQARLSLLLTFH